MTVSVSSDNTNPKVVQSSHQAQQHLPDKHNISTSMSDNQAVLDNRHPKDWSEQKTEHATQTSDTIIVNNKQDTTTSKAREPDSVTQNYANYAPTYMDLYRQRNHRYHGFPEYSMMRAHQPVTARDTTQSEPTTGSANIPYGQNVPITQTDPRPFAGSLNERSSAEHRKFRRHQLEAEFDIQKYKDEKMKQLMIEKEEKKRDMEMLKNYDPYGRPGAGAPLLEGAKKNKFPNDVPNKNYSNEAGFRFGRPGAGAPLRTGSGNIRAEITGDPLIRFHQGKTLQAQQAIKESMRYVTKREEGEEYQKQLDRQLAQKAIADQEARIHELQAELDMLRHDPYGKPGAGAPNHPPTERPDPGNYRPAQKHDQIWHPFGKSGNGAPIKDENGNHLTAIYGRPERERERESQPEVYPFQERGAERSPQGPVTNGGAGAPITTEGEKRAKLPITMTKTEHGETTIKEQVPGTEPNVRESQVWNPFGKSGAGAPLRDNQGNYMTTVYGKMFHDRDSADERRKQRAAREYLNEIQTEMVEQKRNRERDREYQKAPVGELARVLQEGRVGRPRRDPYTGLLTDQHLGMSDVTKHRVNYRSQKTDETPVYHTDLSRAAEARYQAKELDRMKERQRSQMHQEVMDSFWGRPGGGAPNPAGTRYHDPIQAIHSPRRQNEAPQWEHTKDLSVLKKQTPRAQEPAINSPRASYDSPYKFKVRDTTHSTHANQYEYNSPREPLPKKSYNLMTPYATA